MYINKQTYKATAPKQSLDDQIKRLHCLADPLLTRVAVPRSAANWAGAAIGCRLLLLHHSTTRRQQATCPTGPATGSESEEKDGEASNASHHVANPLKPRFPLPFPHRTDRRSDGKRQRLRGEKIGRARRTASRPGRKAESDARRPVPAHPKASGCHCSPSRRSWA